MKLALIPHPADSHVPDISLSAGIDQVSSGRMEIRYDLTGDIGAIAIPDPATASRANNLWERTCFELFIQYQSETGYSEYNFSPSAQWAAYRFAAHRTGRSDIASAHADVSVERSGHAFRLHANVILEARAGSGFMDVGLSAIIARNDGRKSHWALAHDQGKPDFHKSDCFTHRIEAVRRA